MREKSIRSKLENYKVEVKKKKLYKNYNDVIGESKEWNNKIIFKSYRWLFLFLGFFVFWFF